ncbi:MAG: hypothetical protein ACKVYV_04525 [Limisphaerales bacterium]
MKLYLYLLRQTRRRKEIDVGRVDVVHEYPNLEYAALAGVLNRKLKNALLVVRQSGNHLAYLLYLCRAESRLDERLNPLKERTHHVRVKISGELSDILLPLAATSKERNK